jgi:UDP-4-amino-4,6-dideoxy-N-acetyl-beta-L-altrosamine transaminase
MADPETIERNDKGMKQPMKNIPYATQWIDDEDIEAVAAALRSSYLTQGPLVKEFEDKIAKYCGAKYAVAVNSGTSALHAACHAAGVNPGDEVITSPITFVASANAVLYCGGKPVFADISDDTINIGPAEIKNRLSNRTRAIIPVHFAGHPCDMEEISGIAEKNKLSIIEDAAHALGAEYKGTRIGSCKYSDMTVLSFHAVKHITTGEGGIITTNDETLYQKLIRFRTHGITRDVESDEGPWYYEMQQLGYNYRITDFQCALGISQLAKLDRFVARRREIVARYQKEFSNENSLILPIEKENCASSWHLYIIQVKGDRKKTFQTLRDKGIGVNAHYLPVYLQPYYQKLGYKRGSCPKAETYYSRTITLPLYPKMSDPDVAVVIKAVREAI